MANSSALSAASVAGVSLFVESSNVTASRTVLPITSLGDSWEKNVYGVARVSGSIEVLYDKSDHAAIVDAMENATGAVACVFTWNTSETWTGNAFITEVSARASTDDLVKATISFVGDGTWTI
jgi:hypothetical protein